MADTAATRNSARVEGFDLPRGWLLAASNERGRFVLRRTSGARIGLSLLALPAVLLPVAFTAGLLQAIADPAVRQQLGAVLFFNVTFLLLGLSGLADAGARWIVGPGRVLTENVGHGFLPVETPPPARELAERLLIAQGTGPRAGRRRGKRLAEVEGWLVPQGWRAFASYQSGHVVMRRAWSARLGLAGFAATLLFWPLFYALLLIGTLVVVLDPERSFDTDLAGGVLAFAAGGLVAVVHLVAGLAHLCDAFATWIVAAGSAHSRSPFPLGTPRAVPPEVLALATHLETTGSQNAKEVIS